jgi:hypothetical protein
MPIWECIEIRTQHGCLSGLNLGLHNFGAHLGFRYFFTDGFGLFGEAGYL